MNENHVYEVQHSEAEWNIFGMKLRNVTAFVHFLHTACLEVQDGGRLLITQVQEELIKMNKVPKGLSQDLLL